MRSQTQGLMEIFLMLLREFSANLCDGFHIAKFINELQDAMNTIKIKL